MERTPPDGVLGIGLSIKAIEKPILLAGPYKRAGLSAPKSRHRPSKSSPSGICTGVYQEKIKNQTIDNDRSSNGLRPSTAPLITDTCRKGAVD